MATANSHRTMDGFGPHTCTRLYREWHKRVLTEGIRYRIQGPDAAWGRRLRTPRPRASGMQVSSFGGERLRFIRGVAMTRTMATGAFAVIGGLSAALALLTGPPAARADELADLRANQELLQKRIDQLSQAPPQAAP